MSRRTKRNFSELSTPAKAGVVALGVAQVGLAVLAFTDLAGRPADEVRGPKPAWIPVILVNWFGPAAYFVFGRKR
ncbi:hypothetical protein GCM10022286_07150 [Gryllotalpicola daejeonensis]|uniref:Cardiolipin synthase N-terminal domain-containing protein n=1 Tax=Gryllotalpicola daejeonensis TaxID=993087 RepID=A0ABP7ZIL7_9MICO